MYIFLHLQKDTLKNYKCGADFLPSPLASKPQFALKAEALLNRPELLTAVAVAVENDHTVAFLGNDLGGVIKVKFLSSLLLWPSRNFILFYEYVMFSVQVHMTAEPTAYSEKAGVSIGEKVNRNLFFDLSHSHIYITTEKKVTPVGKQPFCNNSKECLPCA